MTFTIAIVLCISGLALASLASYIGSTLRFLGRHDGAADDHQREDVNRKVDV